MPKLVTAAETAHHAAPSSNGKSLMPAPQIHIPPTFGPRCPPWSNNRPVTSYAPPLTKP